jgi:predicted DNA-binding protein
MKKHKTSFTISDECKQLLQLLSARLGISRAGIIEMLVREKAQKENIR